jgi:MFS transporter, DHA1 family, inner membrane transport protein
MAYCPHRSFWPGRPFWCCDLYLLRPIVLFVVPRFGLRLAFVLGTFMCGLQFLFLPMVHGIGIGLALFCAATALSQVFYCTCYHVFYASLGDIDHRGSQIGARQSVSALAEVLGPLAGGLSLTLFGPWPAFGAAFILQMVAIVPLLYVAEPAVELDAPRNAYAEAKIGFRLFFADGWIQISSATAWSILMFQALGERYDSLGALLSAAALAGALGGMVLGRFIDMGHARSIVPINASILAGTLILKSLCGHSPQGVIAVAIIATMLSGFYILCWMTAVYNEAKAAPCTFRFHFVAEGGWDIGGATAGLIAAALCAYVFPIEAAILLALPAVVAQARLLRKSYRREPPVMVTVPSYR